MRLLSITVLMLCLHACATDASAQSPLRKRPTCKAQYAYVNKGGVVQRVKLPMCTKAPRTAVAAAAAAAATAYPCAIGDAACYCAWRGALGFFADNDPAVACK